MNHASSELRFPDLKRHDHKMFSVKCPTGRVKSSSDLGKDWWTLRLIHARGRAAKFDVLRNMEVS